MKITSSTALAAALAAAAVLAPGCRTIHGNRPGATPVAPADESLPAAVPVAGADAPAVAPAAAPDASAVAAADAPAPVLAASQVGTPGTYKQFVLSGEDESDRSYAVEAGGLRGQTGRHVSAPPPAREPDPKPAPAPAGSGFYVVQSGDILGRIAQRHGVSTKALADANGIADPSRIRIGQKLKIPPRGTGLSPKRQPKAAPAPKAVAKAGAKAAAKALPPKAGCTTYVVQSGEILGRIARKFNTTSAKLQELNGIADPTKLRAGQTIYVPAAAGAASAPSPAPSPAKVHAPSPAVDVSEPALPPPPATDGSYFAD